MHQEHTAIVALANDANVDARSLRIFILWLTARRNVTRQVSRDELCDVVASMLNGFDPVEQEQELQRITFRLNGN